jgi:hypothetical protein
MKRASLERERTIRVWRRHLAFHAGEARNCRCEVQIGRFRKAQRVWGCGQARCFLCHGEKLLRRPTLQQRRSDLSLWDWL